MAAKDGRHVGDRADVRLLVRLLAQHHRAFAHGLVREYDVESRPDAHFVQALAQHVRERTVVRPGDVLDPYPRRVGFRSGPHRADDRNVPLETRPDQARLGREGVDRVDDVVEPFVEQRLGLLVADVSSYDRQSQSRVDVQQPSGHDLGFRLADRAVQGRQLAVDVRFGHRIGIRYRHGSDAGPRDRFGRIGPDAAESDDQYAGVSQSFDAVASQQQFRALHPFFHRPNRFR